MTGEVFFLDWSKATLFGIEPKKSDMVIDAIVKGIEAGDEFPPVPVIRIDDHTYELTSSADPGDVTNSGGHHRAVAHYIVSRPLKCKVIKEAGSLSPYAKVRVQDIVLYDDYGMYAWCRKHDPKYR